MKFKKKYSYIICLLFLNINFIAKAQHTLVTASDTVRRIKIVQAKTLRFITKDSLTQLESIAGNCILKEGTTIFYCDSAALNLKTNVLEAFGNVHINDNDSIHTYAQYLKYVGLERTAYLKKNVKLTDKKGVLLTNDLVYDLRTGTATYKNGGKIINEKTVLTSQDGIYYSATKDVYFKKIVHLKDPKYDIKTDSLRYNLKTSEAFFITQTHIVSAEGVVTDTKSGIYNLQTRQAFFFDRTFIRDSTRSLIADEISFDEKTGITLLKHRAKVVDSTNKIIVTGDEIESNQKQKTFLATKKPVITFYKDGDSTFIAADTLFSGIRSFDSTERKSRIKKDTLKKSILIKEKTDTSIRYFIGYHHVKIYNDSIQAISDSMHYSTADSTFKLFGNPIVWNDKTQITGDTLHVYTKNQKPQRVFVFNDAMVINHPTKGVFNQVSGRTINAYFKLGKIDYIRVKGSPAESIVYPQDEDSAYLGMNRSTSDVIDVYVVKEELNKVKMTNNIDGVMYPIRQIPNDKKELKGFKWLDDKRPKSKLALFE